MVSKGMSLSQYAPKGVKSLRITSSQTVYVRKPDLVSCKTQERLGGRPICQIYLNTYFQRARLGDRLICEIGLYAVHTVSESILIFTLYLAVENVHNPLREHLTRTI